MQTTEPARKEGEIVKEILDYLKAVGIEAWRNNVGRKGGITFGKRGLPDILGFTKDGRFLAIEVKRPREGRTSSEQAAFVARAKEAGALAFFARSVEEVMTSLDREGARGGRS